MYDLARRIDCIKNPDRQEHLHTTASTKFWELEKRIKLDKKNPGVLIELSKSDMLWDIAGLIRRNIITIEDLADFSDELKEEVKLILQRSIE